MKKILSLALATLMLAAVFSSCAPAEQLDPAITLASSDAYAEAQWLDNRLDVIPDDVVIGIGSNDTYGINMSNFESDGYVLREIEGDVLIFGASNDGLDRAVRKYAKAAEINQTANLDETYHEGARIKRLTIAGRDISEYVILSADEFSSAAAELQTLLVEATGVTVPISAQETAEPAFKFQWITDESLNTVGHTYTVTDGGVLFKCSDGYKKTSPLWAVWRFLENELDWFGLTAIDSRLSESDHVDIPAGTEVTESNLFEHLAINHNVHNSQFDFRTDRNALTNWSNGTVSGYSAFYHAQHGIQHGLNQFGIVIAGEFSQTGNWSSDLPCYLDEEFYEYSKEDVISIIEQKLASGQNIGEDFVHVDISAPDNTNHCVCEKCRLQYRTDGSAHAGAMVKWANRLSEELNSNKKYEGLFYMLFAYAGTNRPPRRTIPNNHLYINFCYDWTCDTHPKNGDFCTTGQPHGYPNEDSHSLSVLSRQLEEWTKICENVYVWQYAYNDGLNAISYVHTVYGDMKYYRDLGVKGLYWTSYDIGYTSACVSKFLWSTLQWNHDITDEEYQEIYRRTLELYYGDGWDCVEEYLNKQEEVYLAGSCGSCWLCGAGVSPTFDVELYAETYDEMFYLLEEAFPLVNSNLQECRLSGLLANNIYKGSLASYFSAYEAYDDERCAELIRRYALIDERLSKFGVDVEKVWASGDFATGGTFATDLEIQMWTRIGGNYVSSWLGVTLTREMPEGIKEYLESVEADAATAQ